MHNSDTPIAESERSERPDSREPLKKIGVDTGGTFTDIVMHTDNTLFTHKVLSTPQNPAHAVIQGVSEILHKHNTDAEEVEVVHGINGRDERAP